VFLTADTIKDGQITSDDAKSRLNELVDKTLTMAESK